jgi:two-component system chemotaxis response regulator CheB
MPRAALRAVPDAQVASGPKLARLIDELCREEIADQSGAIDRTLEMEAAIPELDEAALAENDRPGRPAAMTCPDCNGAMFELDEGSMVRFRCRVGHAWSLESLLVEQVEAAEGALWAAIRALEEKSALHRRMTDDPNWRQGPMTQAYHHDRATEAERAAAMLREMLRRPLTHEMVREAPAGRN